MTFYVGLFHGQIGCFYIYIIMLLVLVNHSLYNDIVHRVIDFNFILANHADCFKAFLEGVCAMAELAAQAIEEFGTSI